MPDEVKRDKPPLGIDYAGYDPGTTDRGVRERFMWHYGCYPEKIYRSTVVVLAGPIPEVDDAVRD